MVSLKIDERRICDSHFDTQGSIEMSASVMRSVGSMESMPVMRAREEFYQNGGGSIDGNGETHRKLRERNESMAADRRLRQSCMSGIRLSSSWARPKGCLRFQSALYSQVNDTRRNALPVSIVNRMTPIPHTSTGSAAYG